MGKVGAVAVLVLRQLEVNGFVLVLYPKRLLLLMKGLFFGGGGRFLQQNPKP